MMFDIISQVKFREYNMYAYFDDLNKSNLEKENNTSEQS